MGIDPAKKPARDTQAVSPIDSFSERVLWRRWARGPMRSMGIDPAEKHTRDGQAMKVLWTFTKRAGWSRGAELIWGRAWA